MLYVAHNQNEEPAQPKQQRVSRYEAWAKAENDKIFARVLKANEVRYQAIEKEMPGFIQSLREINKP